ncbi:MAG: hypothetical protein HYX47_01915 [Burkholderiales bacterium]|nr:hypothetical protein [Burkholderiales bacterium]
MKLVGIYGYDITRPVALPRGQVIYPRTAEDRESDRWSADPNAYNLTAVVAGQSLERQFLYNLDATLAFVEQADIYLGDVVDGDTPPHFQQFPDRLEMRRRLTGRGCAVIQDWLEPASRGEFIRLCLARLEDQAWCERTQFHLLLHKSIETFRQRDNFVDIAYFLLFSGLEGFARGVAPAPVKSTSRVIVQLLQSYEFDVLEVHTDLPRSIRTYALLRDALFHNGRLETTWQRDGEVIPLTISAYLYNLRVLVRLVILKAVGFDDGRINWNCWIDRMPFKGPHR